MTEKRYYYRDYEELYYIFDSNTISEKEFDEKEEYEGYTAFEDSLTSEEIVNLLNENEQLKSENKRLTDKLNKTALELVDGYISQGKATEISEMSYREFLDYRAKNGKPMELQK